MVRRVEGQLFECCSKITNLGYCMASVAVLPLRVKFDAVDKDVDCADFEGITRNL
jgi:hypothetical protein